VKEGGHGRPPFSQFERAKEWSPVRAGNSSYRSARSAASILSFSSFTRAREYQIAPTLTRVERGDCVRAVS
jgi:hypothetical protein